MIEPLRLVNPVNIRSSRITLHPEILEILYEHRRHVRSIFQQICGIYEISYFGLTIIDPAYEMVIFSSAPNIEYNLIKQDLWAHDFCFFSPLFRSNRLYWWDEANEKNDLSKKIERIKLANNKFSLGMTIPRQIDNFLLLYSYATKTSRNNSKDYYISNRFGLMDLGDYFWKSISALYSEYNEKYTLPKLHQFTSRTNTNTRPALELVVKKG